MEQTWERDEMEAETEANGRRLIEACEQAGIAMPVVRQAIRQRLARASRCQPVTPATE